MIPYLDSFISAEHHRDPVRRRQSRLTLYFSVMFVCVLPIVALIHVLAGAPLAALPALAACCISLLVPTILQRSQSPTLAANVLICDLLATIISLSVLTGGPNAPGLIWIVLLPVLGFALLGVAGGMMWTIAGLVWLLIVYGIHIASPFSTEIPADSMMALYAATLIGLVAMLGVCAVLVDRTFSMGLQDLLQTRKAQQVRLQELERERRVLAIRRLEVEWARRIQRRFLVRLSDEMRTPMNTIIGFSGVLESDELQDGREDRAADLRQIRGAGIRLLGVANEAMELAQIDSRGDAIHVEECSVPELLHELEPPIVRAGEKRETSVIFSCDSDVDVVSADREKLRQSLLNLLENAVEATKNGAVSLHVHREQDGVCFEVRDSGGGMTAHRQQEVMSFPPLLDSGLGLAIAQHYANAMGGSLAVESSPGKGSVFFLRIPA